MSFYSTPKGTLTSEINGTGTPISTFLNGTTGYIDTWYDQSGKGNHATQTTFSSQPVFNVSNIDFGYVGSLSLFLNIPSGTVPVGALDLSYSFVVKYGNSNNTGNGGFIGSGTFASGVCNNFRLASGINKYNNYWYGKDVLWSDTSITTLPIISSVTYNGTTKNISGYMNGVSKLGVTTRTGMTNAYAVQTLGRTVANEYFKGYIYTVLIFSTTLLSSDITIINDI
jgi:hypothetical protein